LNIHGESIDSFICNFFHVANDFTINKWKPWIHRISLKRSAESYRHFISTQNDKNAEKYYRLGDQCLFKTAPENRSHHATDTINAHRTPANRQAASDCTPRIKYSDILIFLFVYARRNTFNEIYKKKKTFPSSRPRSS